MLREVNSLGAFSRCTLVGNRGTYRLKGHAGGESFDRLYMGPDALKRAIAAAKRAADGFVPGLEVRAHTQTGLQAVLVLRRAS
jgi:hypothetical protein